MLYVGPGFPKELIPYQFLYPAGNYLEKRFLESNIKYDLKFYKIF